MREGDQNHIPYLTSVHDVCCLFPADPLFVSNARASATLGIDVSIGTDLDCEALLRQFRALLLVNGERGLLVRPLYRLLISRQWRSHRAPLETRGTPVVPRRVW